MKGEGRLGEGKGESGRDLHSAQLGLCETVEVICLFSALSVTFALVSRSRNSCLLLGGIVKRRGREDMLESVTAVAACMLTLTLRRYYRSILVATVKW